MSKPAYVPKHRVPPQHRAARGPRVAKRLTKGTVVMTSLAAAATGAVVTTGILGGNVAAPVSAALQRPLTGTDGQLSSAELADRDATTPVSRSDRRTAADPAKVAALSSDDSPAVTRSENLADADPRTIAQALLPEFGFGPEQFQCLDPLWMGESGWRVNADNPHSSAYGIPQALPGSKMSSEGADWATNPVTQIRWGLGYIADRYGTPCGAWSFKQGHGWY